jgi:L-asparaginase II
MSEDNPVLVHVQRGGVVESMHRGALAVVDAAGAVHTAIGDIARPIFPRSAVKVLQALPLVESGAADAFGLTDEELALACASHGGEPAHVSTAAAMLAKAGADETALECGAHWPLHEPSARALFAAGGKPGALHNNCSGKHAGFVCLGCHLARAAGQEPEAWLRGYVKPDHPVMREVGAALEAATGVRLAGAPRGTDGCSIPTYAMPLAQLALAFARVATGQGLSPGRAAAARRLREAVAHAPHRVAGEGRFDTKVIQRLGTRVFCKTGAEAVYCAALPELGLGIALKIDDGQTRASEVAMAVLIAQLLPLADADAAFLQTFTDAPARNWNGVEVGRLTAAPELRAGTRR